MNTHRIDRIERLLAIREARALAGSGQARALRQRAGLSLSEVAEALGVEGTTVWRWEEGKSTPRSQIAVEYRELLRRLEGSLELGPSADLPPRADRA